MPELFHKCLCFIYSSGVPSIGGRVLILNICVKHQLMVRSPDGFVVLVFYKRHVPQAFAIAAACASSNICIRC